MPPSDGIPGVGLGRAFFCAVEKFAVQFYAAIFAILVVFVNTVFMGARVIVISTIPFRCRIGILIQRSGHHFFEIHGNQLPAPFQAVICTI